MERLPKYHSRWQYSDDRGVNGRDMFRLVDYGKLKCSTIINGRGVWWNFILSEGIYSTNRYMIWYGICRVIVVHGSLESVIAIKPKELGINSIDRGALYTSITTPHSLQWRHDECDVVSNHRRFNCLFNCWFRRRSKKTPKPRAAGLYVGNSPVMAEFPVQQVSNTENVSIWCRHRVLYVYILYLSRVKLI